MIRHDKRITPPISSGGADFGFGIAVLRLVGAGEVAFAGGLGLSAGIWRQAGAVCPLSQARRVKL